VEASAGAGVLLSWSGVSGRCGWSGANRRLSWVAGLWVAGLWVAGLWVAGLWVAGLWVAELWVAELWVAGFSVGVVLAAACVAAVSPLEFAEDVSGGAGSGFATPVLVASLDAFGVCAAGG
jgi:hypothetical protein